MMLLLKPKPFQRLLMLCEKNPPYCSADPGHHPPAASPKGEREGRTYLLPVAGHVGEQRGHVEHELVVFVGGVEGVGSCGVGWEPRSITRAVRPRQTVGIDTEGHSHKR